MTKIYNGKIVGNNLRRKYGPDYQQPPEDVKTSTVEFETREPFLNASSFVMYEIEGFYPIGTAVWIEMTMVEPIL